ncbi:hypothetical protein JZ751_008535, partial [Albula glossodonta]
MTALFSFRMLVYPECTMFLLLSLCHVLASFGSCHLPPCEPINETISVEKEGCPKCLVFQTSICSGHCFTKSALSPVYQHVCTYRDVRYETVRLPDCPPGVDPHVTYPIALSCACTLCTMDTSDCTIESLRPDYCMSHPTSLS